MTRPNIVSGTKCSYSVADSAMFGEVSSGKPVTMDGDKDFTISLTPKHYTATINVTGAPNGVATVTGTTVQGSYSNKGDCGAGTTQDGQLVIPNIPYGTTCSYSVTHDSYTTGKINATEITSDTTLNTSIQLIVGTVTFYLNYAAAGLADSNGNPLNAKTTEEVHLCTYPNDTACNDITGYILTPSSPYTAPQIGSGTTITFSNVPVGTYYYYLHSNNQDTVDIRPSNDTKIIVTNNGQVSINKTLQVANYYAELSYAQGEHGWDFSSSPWLQWINTIAGGTASESDFQIIGDMSLGILTHNLN